MNEEAELLDQVADLLYEIGDPRATPWPAAAILGRLRSRIRALADEYRDPDDPNLSQKQGAA